MRHGAFSGGGAHWPFPSQIDDDGKLEALGLVDGHDLDRFGSDGMGRVELDGLIHPLPHAGGRGVVVESFVGGELLQEQAKLAQPREALRAVRARGDVAREGRAFQQIPRGRAGRAVESRRRRSTDEIASFARAKGGFSGGRLSGRVAARSRRRSAGSTAKKGGRSSAAIGDAVVAVRDGSQAEQELPVERVLEKEDSAARGVRDAFVVQRSKQKRKAPCRDRQDRDIAVSHLPGAACRAGRRSGRRPSRQPAQIASQRPAFELAVLITLCFSPSAKARRQDMDGWRAADVAPAASGCWKTRPVIGSKGVPSAIL